MKRTTYPGPVRHYIEQHYKEQDAGQMAQALRETLGTQYTPQQIARYKKNHRLVGGPRREWKNKNETPAEVAAFISACVEGHTSQQIADAVNLRFGTQYTPQQIASYKKNHRLVSNVDTKIKPGNTPPNKGKKGHYAPGSEKGWFKKGHTPHNHLPVGAEAITTDGYKVRKMKEPNVWEFVHLLNWRAAYGPVPPGCMVCFNDGDRLNVAAENLHLETRAEHGVINRCGLRTADAALNKSGHLLAKVKIATNAAKRQLKERRK